MRSGLLLIYHGSKTVYLPCHNAYYGNPVDHRLDICGGRWREAVGDHNLRFVKDVTAETPWYLTQYKAQSYIRFTLRLNQQSLTIVVELPRTPARSTNKTILQTLIENFLHDHSVMEGSLSEWNGLTLISLCLILQHRAVTQLRVSNPRYVRFEEDEFHFTCPRGLSPVETTVANSAGE